MPGATAMQGCISVAGGRMPGATRVGQEQVPQSGGACLALELFDDWRNRPARARLFDVREVVGLGGLDVAALEFFEPLAQIRRVRGCGKQVSQRCL